MALKDHLHTSMRGGIYDDIREICLSKRMQMNLRLLKNDGRSFRYVLQERDHWEHLRHPKTDIR